MRLLGFLMIFGFDHRCEGLIFPTIVDMCGGYTIITAILILVFWTVFVGVVLTFGQVLVSRQHVLLTLDTAEFGASSV